MTNDHLKAYAERASATASPSGVTRPDNPYSNALVWGGKWTGEVTYSLYVAADSDLSAGTDVEKIKWTTAEAAAVQKAFDLWSSVANIKFKKIDDSPSSTTHADLRLAKLLDTGSTLGFFYGPSTGDSTDFWSSRGVGGFNYDGRGWTPEGLAQGGYGFVTLVHEIGHAIGLAHPHDDGGESGYFPGVEPNKANDFTEDSDRLGDYELNQGVWTMMSYNDGLQSDDNASDIYGWQATPMSFDIAAIQHIYGKSENNKGATTYTLPDSNASGTYYSCIWDYNSAGDKLEDADIITYSGSKSCTIDLRAAPLTGEHAGGYISKVDGVFGGFTIANGVTIENATSGAGNDTLIGNDADNILIGNAGADTLTGGKGTNKLDGGAGNDVYKFDGAGIDTIVDVSGSDMLSAEESKTAANINLRAGETSTINGSKVTLTGAGTASLMPADVYLLQDLSGSFSDDMYTVRSLIPSLIDGMKDVQPDITFGFGSFIDYPVSPFGSTGDYIFQNHLNLTTDSSALQTAVNTAVVKDGYDTPEAQLPALLTAARQYAGLGFRSDSYHAVVLLTDASYHVKGDEASAYSSSASVSYPSISQVRDALSTARISPIFAVTSGSRSYYEELVNQLGFGTVVTLNSDSSNIVAAIKDGLDSSSADTIEDATGSDYGDIIVGNALDNKLIGGEGDDRITGLQGNDYISGGGGTDTLVLSGDKADYNIIQRLGLTYVSEKVEGVDQTDRLFSIEQIQFADQSMSLGIGSYIRSLYRDFTGDAKADVVFKNADGRVALWSMDGATRREGKVIATLSDTQWLLPGIGDFDGDGTEDLLFQHADGRIATWTMDGTTRTAGTVVGQLANPKWSASSTGDFNGDNKSDILFEGTDGEIAIWTMDGAERFKTNVVAKNADTQWSVAGAADFNYDGSTDIIFRHSDGRLGMWLMDDAEKVSASVFATLADTKWRVAGTGDLNGDYMADIVLQHEDGRIALWTMDGMTRTSGQVIDTLSDKRWSVADIADYDGDSRDDILFASPDGKIAMWSMDGATRRSGSLVGTLSDTNWAVATNGAF